MDLINFAFVKYYCFVHLRHPRKKTSRIVNKLNKTDSCFGVTRKTEIYPMTEIRRNPPKNTIVLLEYL